MSSSIIGHIEVCVDCLTMHANGEAPTDPQAGRPAPWALWTPDNNPDELTVSMDYDSETEDGMTTFSGSPCGGCGSWLAGERFRFAVWSK